MVEQLISLIEADGYYSASSLNKTRSIIRSTYRLYPVNSNTVNSKLTLNSNFLDDLFAK